MFRAPKGHEEIKDIIDQIVLKPYDEIKTQRGWVKAKDLDFNDLIKTEDNSIIKIISIEEDIDKVIIRI